LAIIPLFFLPVTQYFYDTHKWILLVGVTVCIVYASLIQGIWKTKPIHVKLSPLSIGLGSITLASLISILVISVNKPEALLAPFGPITFAALTLLALFAPTFLDEKTSFRLRSLLYGTTSILALIAVYQFFGMGKMMFPHLLYLADPLWTPTGSTTATTTLFVIMLPLLVWDAFGALKKKQESRVAFFSIMTITVITGLGITLWQLVPKLSSTLLSLRDGWSIMLEILKNPKHALVGVGAENFLTAFASGRSPSYNLSPVWSLRFTTNANIFFHIITTYGLIGGAACLLFFKSFITRKYINSFTVSLLVAFAGFFLTPPNLTVLIVSVMLLILSDPPHGKTISIKLPHSMRVRIGIALLCILFFFGVLYGVARAYIAELTFYQSLLAAQANNGTATYNLQGAAIIYNPSISRFHIVYSQTSLALATSLAQTLTQSDPPLTDDEKIKNRDLMGQLTQQAIREAKVAVSLNPTNILAWENLARTYSQLIEAAQGADNWAIVSFKQSIVLDPINPVLHVDIGAVYVRLKDFTQAITHFQKAISLKPDYANAYYNLANAYKQSGDTDMAITTMTQALSFVEKNSQDYATVSEELEILKNTTTIPPQPTPTQAAVAPIDLPVDAGPDVSP
jgi:tetratricopeptide (TPR) repeat protein